MSLCPIYSKIFKKIIFNSFFKYLADDKLLYCNQTGFKACDSCVHQLLSIKHELCKSFDTNPSLEVWGVFFEISKALGPVWHNGRLYRLKLLGICGRYYNLIQLFLDSRHQRVVLNGQSSKGFFVEAGVLQGSILGLLLFRVDINDLPQGFRCN